MATAEEIQRLVMQVEGERELRKLVAQQVDAEKLMGRLIERFEQGKISQQDYARRTEIVANHILRLREKTEETEKALGKLGGATAKYGHEMRTLGYAAQDFAQGGFGAILNNIDGLLYKFPALAGAATIAATAIWAFGPPIKQMVEGLIAGSNQIPETTDRLEKLNEQVQKNASRLKELKEKQSLTNKELAEYNEILGEQTGLEKQANDERERRNALEEARRKEQERAHPHAKESGAEAFEAIQKLGGEKKARSRTEAALANAGFNSDVLNELQVQRNEILDKLKEALDDGVRTMYERNLSRVDASMEAARRGRREKADALVADALRGDEQAIGVMSGLFPGQGFDKATPEGLKASRDAAEKEARSRQFNADQARQAVGNWLYRTINPIATSMKDDRAAQAAARQNSLDIAANMTEARKAQEAANKQAERDRITAEREAAREAAAAPGRARAAQLQEITDRLRQDTGGQLPEAVLAGAAKSTQQLMDQGVMPLAAAQMALAEVAAANERLMQQMQALEAGFNTVAEHQRMMRSQNSRMMGGQISGGGFSMLPMYQGGW